MEVYALPVQRLALLPCLALVALAGCDRDGSTELHGACEAGEEVYLRALAAAPDAVLLEGDTRISQCFVSDAEPGDVTIVGTALLGAAQRLADGRRALELGYLLGAARRGAARTQGIYDELIRRLEQEAGALADEPAFGEGESLGSRHG